MKRMLISNVKSKGSMFFSSLTHRTLPVALVAFIGLSLFYTITAPHNHTEADDAYTYAYMIETNSLTPVYDTRLMLYFMSMRIIYVVANAFLENVSAVSVLQIVSVVSAALCLILFYRLLLDAFGVSPRAALMGTAFLGLCYGFWRYATEVEVYTPSAFLVMSVMWLALKAEKNIALRANWPAIIPAALLSGFAVLFYKGNVIPLFMALPVLFLYKSRYSWIITYYIVGGLVVIGGYLIGYILSHQEPVTARHFVEFLTMRQHELVPASISVKTVLMSVLAFGHNILSSNWIFGFDTVTDILHREVPYRSGTEDIYAASKAGWLIFVPFITLPVFFCSLAWATITAFSNRGSARRDRWIAFSIVWFITYYIVGLVFLANRLEAWVMVLPPFAVLFSKFIIEPCVRARKLSSLFLILLSLFIHNSLSGIGIVYSADGDYFKKKTEWIIYNATENDLVIFTGDKEIMRRYVRYYSKARTVRISESDVENAIAEAYIQKGRIFVFEDFFSPPDWLAHYNSADYALSKRLANAYIGCSRSVFRNDAGETFELVCR